MKLMPSYNAPVTLTFTLISMVVLALSLILPGQAINDLLGAPTSISFGSLMFYPNLVTHIFAHANWAHFWGNFSFLLLLGPLLEEKYGSGKLFLLIIATALFTAVLNATLFSTGLIGASGIVFLFIVLGSFAGENKGRIPMTFILIFGIYMTKEIVSALQPDNISQFAHLMGGFCGSAFGFLVTKKARQIK